jgi:hypothetical protein
MQPTSPTTDGLRSPIITPAGEQCPACAAPMAGDQRYCVECGERRGQPRLPYMDGRPRTAAAAPSPRRSLLPRTSSGTALIAGIATLLLAMGVGVLIGRSGNAGTTASAPAVQVLTVPGAAAPTAAAGTSTTGTSTLPAGATATAGDKAAPKKSTSTTSSAPTSTPKSKTPPVVKLGSKGKGKGFKDGKFTGDFFGN